MGQLRDRLAPSSLLLLGGGADKQDMQQAGSLLQGLSTLLRLLEMNFSQIVIDHPDTRGCRMAPAATQRLVGRVGAILDRGLKAPNGTGNRRDGR